MIVFSSWSTYVYLFTRHMTSLTDSVMGAGEQGSELQRYSGIVSTGQVKVATQIQTALNIYGQSIVLVGVTFLCVVFIGWLYLKRHERVRNHALYFGAGFLIFLVSAIISLALIDIFGWVRILAVACLLGIIVVSAYFWPMLDRLLSGRPNDKQKIVRLVSIGVIVFALLYSPCSTCTCHPSCAGRTSRYRRPSTPG